jgi:vancomycin permeability regulator SanA
MEASKSLIFNSIKRVSLVLALWFLFETIITVSFGISLLPIEFNPDVIVVFGNKVNVDGSLSKRLEARMTRALEMHKKFPNAKLFVSGGLGKEGHLEGNKMANYLIKKGVSKDRISIDNEGYNSLATIENLKEEFGNKKVLFVSQFYHLRRIEVIAKKKGFEQFESTATAYFEFRDFYSLFREFFAIYKYKLIL